MEYVYELNLPPVQHIFLENFTGWNDDSLKSSYYYEPDISKILKKEWITFNNTNFDLILYFRKDNCEGHIHTDINLDFYRNAAYKVCHPWGINWIWDGDGQFEYWHFEDTIFTYVGPGTTYDPNIGQGRLYTTDLPPRKKYPMYKDKAYLVYGGIPHRASGKANRRLLSLRNGKSLWRPWHKIVDMWKNYIIN